MTTGTDAALRYFTNEAAALRASAAENREWAAEADAAGRREEAEDFRAWATNADVEAARHEATLARMANEGAIWF
jgi:hypothetical protein